MPNHCETDLTITAPAATIEAIRAAHFTPDGALDCGSVIPYPEEYRAKDEAARAWAEQYGDEVLGMMVRPELKDDPTVPPRPKDGFNSGGYEWCCTNWGTKWGTYDAIPISIEAQLGEQATLTASFQSAWAPPTPVLDALAARYPEARIMAQSYEGGCCFKIETEWADGEQMRYEETTYHGPRGG